MLPENPTAGDVIEKMGSPAGEIAVPWFMYHAADHEGGYYVFRFAHGRRGHLRPRDRLVLVQLVASDQTLEVWPWNRVNRTERHGEPGATDNPDDAQRLREDH